MFLINAYSKIAVSAVLFVKGNWWENLSPSYTFSLHICLPSDVPYISFIFYPKRVDYFKSIIGT